MSTELTGFRYAVRIDCADGRSFLAIGCNDVGVSLYKTKLAAISYRAELKKYLDKGTKLKVVKVSFTIKETP